MEKEIKERLAELLENADALTEEEKGFVRARRDYLTKEQMVAAKDILGEAKVKSVSKKKKK
jgi:hypothetical protein